MVATAVMLEQDENKVMVLAAFQIHYRPLFAEEKVAWLED